MNAGKLLERIGFGIMAVLILGGILTGIVVAAVLAWRDNPWLSLVVVAPFLGISLAVIGGIVRDGNDS